MGITMVFVPISLERRFSLTEKRLTLALVRLPLRLPLPLPLVSRTF